MASTQLDCTSILERAVLIVREVADRYFSDDRFGVSAKNSNHTDLVTEHDVKIEQELYERFVQEFPSFRFVGEEGACQLTNKCDAVDTTLFYWIIDPIDGTTNYVHALYSQSCVSVALVHNDAELEPVLGLIYQPSMKKCYCAVRGKGAYLVEYDKIESVRTSLPLKSDRPESLATSLIATEWNLPMIGCIPEYKNWVQSMASALISVPVHGIRSFGSAAMSLVRVAEGAIDLYYEVGIHAWDVAAGILLVKEAGGSVENIASSSSFELAQRSVVASVSPTILRQFKTTMESSPAYEDLVKILPQITRDILA